MVLPSGGAKPAASPRRALAPIFPFKISDMVTRVVQLLEVLLLIAVKLKLLLQAAVTQTKLSSIRSSRRTEANLLKTLPTFDWPRCASEY